MFGCVSLQVYMIECVFLAGVHVWSAILVSVLCVRPFGVTCGVHLRSCPISTAHGQRQSREYRTVRTTYMSSTFVSVKYTLPGKVYLRKRPHKSPIEFLNPLQWVSTDILQSTMYKGRETRIRTKNRVPSAQDQDRGNASPP